MSVTQCFLAFSAVQLHASAVVRDGASVLFAGASGAGKTTIARKLAAVGWDLLHEEWLVVARGGARHRAIGGHWSPDWQWRRREATLCALFALQPGSPLALRPCPPGESLGILMKSVIWTGAPSPEDIAAALEILNAVTESLPVMYLASELETPGAEIDRLIRAHVNI